MIPRGRLDWSRDGRAWPNRDASRFVRLDGIEWHVQIAGEGRPILLLHGAGAASHSWAGLLPRLATRHRVIAPDLPGHGFTTRAPEPVVTPALVARRLGDLLGALDMAPHVAVGHSAGAAIAAQMVIDGHATPAGLVASNGALLPFAGLPGLVLPAMARWLHWSPAAASLLSFAAIDPNAVPQMIKGTGSVIDARGIELYRSLFRSPGHVAGTIAMMAHWRLESLAERLPMLDLPVQLIVGERDKAVPPGQADQIATLLPNANILRLEGAGHLAHEEDPVAVAEAIFGFCDRLSAREPPQ